MSNVSENISKNIKQLRETRGVSQEQLAKTSGIPRPTWSNLESGSANPTIHILLRVAATLQISLEELIGPPRETCQFYPADTVLIQKRGDSFIRKLLPHHLPGVDFDRMEIAPGSRIAGIPHKTGTKEYLTCEKGSIELAVTGEKYKLTSGDVVAFRGDQKHSYMNNGREPAVGFSVVIFSPYSLEK